MAFWHSSNYLSGWVNSTNPLHFWPKFFVKFLFSKTNKLPRSERRKLNIYSLIFFFFFFSVDLRGWRIGIKLDFSAKFSWQFLPALLQLRVWDQWFFSVEKEASSWMQWLLVQESSIMALFLFLHLFLSFFLLVNCWSKKSLSCCGSCSFCTPLLLFLLLFLFFFCSCSCCWGFRSCCWGSCSCCWGSCSCRWGSCSCCWGSCSCPPSPSSSCFESLTGPPRDNSLLQN